MITLNSGYKIPNFGLGTWDLIGKNCEVSVYNALKIGYRLIDTAKYYDNEREVGKAVRRAIAEGIVKREDIFVTSKIGPYGYKNYDKAIKESNDALGLDYIDLMLIHQSGSDDVEIYNAIKRAVHEGIVKSLGISNYYSKEAFDRITKGQDIMPAVIQNENHIFYQNTNLQKYVNQYGTILESYYPFGGRGHTSDSMNNDVIQSLAEKHRKTGAQIILRWHLQAGYIVIPCSGNREHIAENFDVFDFELSSEEMKQIENLDTGNRYETW